MTRIRVENLEGLDRLKEKFARLANPDATDLMLSWQSIIREDNRRGVLSGTDKDGMPMAPVTYRPIADRIDVRSKGSSQLRHGQRANRMHDLLFKGMGPHASGLHNNLTSAEYRRLDGPPLAPRRQFSRVISNLRTGFTPGSSNTADNLQWEAFGYWDDVVGQDGLTRFLKFHFDGDRIGRRGPSIRRDLRGVRPEGRQEAIRSLRAWVIDRVKRE